MATEEYLNLKSLEGTSHSVSKRAAQLSVTIKELMEDLGVQAGDIPTKIKNETLVRVISWLEDSRDRDFEVFKKKPEQEDEPLPDLSEEDKEVCNGLSDEEVIDLIMAANLLDIKPLLDITTMWVASLVKGKSPEELRKILEGETNKQPPKDLELPKAVDLVEISDQKDSEKSKRKR